MKVVIAIDSFKGSISSPDAGAAIREGIHRVFPDAEVFVRPLADGGEGTVEALAIGMHWPDPYSNRHRSAGYTCRGSLWNP